MRENTSDESRTAGAAAQKRNFDLAGETVRWSESGSGFPVVLVHGIPTSPDLWRRVGAPDDPRRRAAELRPCAS